MKNCGIPKIHVFLHPETLKCHVVGELSCWGHKLEIDVLIFVPLCYWKGAKFMGKIYIRSAILMCIVDALSKSFCAGGGAESALVISFLCKVLRRKDSLPFPREKIDSGVLWHNFGIFTHTKVWVVFLSFFFF